MDDNKYLVMFAKPYNFEGTEFNGIDLAGVENLTTRDLADADKQFIKSGQIATVNEMSIGYACIIAAKVTNQPIEFFEFLPANEGIKVKNVVTNFFYN
jgi:hypothetical protein